MKLLPLPILSTFSPTLMKSNSGHSLSITPAILWDQCASQSKVSTLKKKDLHVSSVFVTDLLPPIVTFLSLTPTSAEVSFTQPEDSLPADDYVISLTLSGTEKSIEERLEGEEGEEEKDGVVVDGKSPLMGFDSLTEFSTYDLVVTTTNRAYRAKRSTRIKFATPSSGKNAQCSYIVVVFFFSLVPTSPPESITFSQTSRDVIVSWSPINCSKCSGPITKYVVDFHSTDTGALTLGMVLDETFVAVGLIPHTSYTFRVAGMNNNGTGPYSDPITITTDTESELRNEQRKSRQSH